MRSEAKTCERCGLPEGQDDGQCYAAYLWTHGAVQKGETIACLKRQVESLRAQLARVTTDKADLEWRIVHNAGRLGRFKRSRLAWVMSATGLGSTRAAEMLARVGLDADEMIPAPSSPAPADGEK